MDARAREILSACEEPPNTGIGTWNIEIRNVKDNADNNGLVQAGHGSHHVPKMVHMRTRRDRKNDAGMLPYRMETSIHGLEVLQHSGSKLCAYRRGDLRTILGTGKVQILHHRTP